MRLACKREGAVGRTMSERAASVLLGRPPARLRYSNLFAAYDRPETISFAVTIDAVAAKAHSKALSTPPSCASSSPYGHDPSSKTADPREPPPPTFLERFQCRACFAVELSAIRCFVAPTIPT